MPINCLIHANIHRVKEGARVLEEIARFILLDETLFKKIRELRHALQSIPPNYSSQSDFGGPSLKEDNIRCNLMDLLQANFTRIQEALRVLEEFSQNSMNKEKIKSLRYTAYEIQQQLYQKTLLFLKRDKLKGLYLVIDPDIINLPLEKIAAVINHTPVNLVQFRSKLLTKRAFLEKALKFKSLLNPDKLFIINDHLDIALDIGDGVHLGQTDYPLERVRRIVPDHFLFGVTCHNLEEAKIAEAAGVSYLAVGCIFPTKSKADTISTTLLELKTIREKIQLPVCAIGGINLQNLPLVLESNIDMAAVISSVWQNPNPISAIKSIHEQVSVIGVKYPLGTFRF